jgi:hypothetical protein
MSEENAGERAGAMQLRLSTAELPSPSTADGHGGVHDCWLSKKPLSDFRFGEDLCEFELEAVFDNH